MTDEVCDLRGMLLAVLAYFEDRADSDWLGMGPNQEFFLMQEIKEVLEIDD